MRVLLFITLLFSFATIPVAAHQSNNETFEVSSSKKYFAKRDRYTLDVNVPADKLNSEFTMTIKNGRHIKLRDCSKLRHHWRQRWCESINEWKSRFQQFTRVDGAYILINGETVVSPQTLNKNIEDLEITIPLQSSNQIEIQLHGHRHSFIKMKIKGSEITNVAPVASAETTNGEARFLVNNPVTFDATTSTDPDGQIAEYQWDFGDGTTLNTTEAIIPHTYTVTGDFTVSLVVVDDQGASSLPISLEITIDVPAPLVADFQVSPGLNGPAPFTIDAVNTSTSQDTTINFVLWNTSDGGSGTGDIFTHTFEEGSHTLTMTVFDDFGRSASKTVAIEATGTLP